ncbi:NirD/YgiW/YdeI family stress tolerance protein [Vibrio sp. SM6]|uniref:NirD/YgiW/YdeI family stress tolerance protein n=1 Tax=Vibrio agarilyticus TaxID=2726741 RepID=A0A7X8YFU0_9VIBR|nr:NirD/YgiW/YdeI family stress tolerance protein [Vibrio agarilyticus]
MKFIALPIALFSAATMAKNDNLGGGFNGPFSGITTVSEAVQANDDTPVVLTGYLVKSLGNENYLFKDASGEVEIEIDDDLWRGVTVSPETKVILEGEVDNDFAESLTVDVDRIRLAS